MVKIANPAGRFGFASFKGKRDSHDVFYGRLGKKSGNPGSPG